MDNNDRTNELLEQITQHNKAMAEAQAARELGTTLQACGCMLFIAGILVIIFFPLLFVGH